MLKLAPSKTKIEEKEGEPPIEEPSGVEPTPARGEASSAEEPAGEEETPAEA